jgi:hypothetical protein
MSRQANPTNTFAGFAGLLVIVVLGGLLINGSLTLLFPAFIMFYAALIFVNGFDAGMKKRNRENRR